MRSFPAPPEQGYKENSSEMGKAHLKPKQPIQTMRMANEYLHMAYLKRWTRSKWLIYFHFLLMRKLFNCTGFLALCISSLWIKKAKLAYPKRPFPPFFAPSTIWVMTNLVRGRFFLASGEIIPEIRTPTYNYHKIWSGQLYPHKEHNIRNHEMYYRIGTLKFIIGIGRKWKFHRRTNVSKTATEHHLME